MYALLTHDNPNGLGCRILARECLDVCAVTQNSFDTLQVGDILEKIGAAWTDGRSSVNTTANERTKKMKRKKRSKQEATMNKGDNEPLMQKVPKSVNDIRLGQLALNEGHDIGQI
jgi:hypothetical protein